MPSSKFIVESTIKKSFKNDKVKGMFDIDMTTVRKEFDVNIPIESMKWNVGLIVGSSGSGKTTIARRVFEKFKLFSGFEWSDNSIIDDFSNKLSAKEITEILSKVGFSSPPDWLKPFAVLSNGQKMRVELARLIIESNEPVIYDEFTSVVDRQVAKIGSYAISKFIKKEDKQFIAVSCHKDIIEWLEPDWVFDVDEMKFSRGNLRRPEIRVDVRRAKQEEWRLFKQFHYLTGSHNNAAHKYIAEVNGEAVGWCSVLHFPHPKVSDIKKLHRTVIKPDYQGVGIGSALRLHISRIYHKEGYRVRTTIASPALIVSMQRSENWIMVRKPSRVAATSKKGVLKNAVSSNRLTCSFQYKY